MGAIFCFLLSHTHTPHPHTHTCARTLPSYSPPHTHSLTHSLTPHTPHTHTHHLRTPLPTALMLLQSSTASVHAHHATTRRARTPPAPPRSYMHTHAPHARYTPCHHTHTHTCTRTHACKCTHTPTAPHTRSRTHRTHPHAHTRVPGVPPQPTHAPRVHERVETAWPSG